MKRTSRHLLSCAAVGLCVPFVSGQEQWPQQVISTGASGAVSVYAADLDGDGDADVLSASYLDNKIAWYENRGGFFGSLRVINTDAARAMSVYAADLDGDGDVDVLSASYDDDKIAWYENRGRGFFGQQQVITTAANGAMCVRAADLDGDGDSDVLSASYADGKIAWYENLGSGAFGLQRVIADGESHATSICAADLDGDGDVDVLSTSAGRCRVAWYENQGDGAFGPPQVITNKTTGAYSVYATDLDGDGDADVISASSRDQKVAWYENRGAGSFGPQRVISTRAIWPCSVYATDLDGDGDADVLSAARNENDLAWYENQGGGSFGPLQVITTGAHSASSVYAADLDGDGNVDVLSASVLDNKIASYENVLFADCNGNGIPDQQDIASGTSADRDLNGIPDECETAQEPQAARVSVSLVESHDSFEMTERYGRIRGSVKLSKGYRPSSILLDAYTREPALASKVHFGNGVSFLASLRVGEPWRFRIVGSCGHTLFQSRPITVVAGETIHPPSLQEIDLTGLLCRLELRVLTPDLKGIDGAHIGSVLGDHLLQGFTRVSRKESGWFRAVGCDRDHRVRVAKVGFCSKDITLGSARAQIVLARGYMVSLELDEAVNRPGPDWQLGATPAPGKTATPDRYLTFEGTDPIRVRIPTPGKYRIEWTLCAPGGSGPTVLRSINGATRHIEVLDIPGDQAFALSIPNAALEAAMEKLRGKD